MKLLETFDVNHLDDKDCPPKRQLGFETRAEGTLVDNLATYVLTGLEKGVAQHREYLHHMHGVTLTEETAQRLSGRLISQALCVPDDQGRMVLMGGPMEAAGAFMTPDDTRTLR